MTRTTDLSVEATYAPSFHPHVTVGVRLERDGAVLRLDDESNPLSRAQAQRLVDELARLRAHEPFEPFEHGEDGMHLTARLTLADGRSIVHEHWSPTLTQHPRAAGFFLALLDLADAAAPGSSAERAPLREYLDVGLSWRLDDAVLSLHTSPPEHVAEHLVAAVRRHGPRILDLLALQALPAGVAWALAGLAAESSALQVCASKTVGETLVSAGWPPQRLFDRVADAKVLVTCGATVLETLRTLRGLMPVPGVIGFRAETGAVVVQVRPGSEPAVRTRIGHVLDAGIVRLETPSANRRQDPGEG